MSRTVRHIRTMLLASLRVAVSLAPSLAPPLAPPLATSLAPPLAASLAAPLAASLAASLAAPVQAADCDTVGVPGVDPLIDNGVIVGLESGVAIQDFIAAFNQQFPNLQAVAVDQVPGRPVHLVSLVPPKPGQFQTVQNWLYATPLLAYHDFLYTTEAPEGKTGSTWVDQVVPLTAFTSQYFLSQTGVISAQMQSQAAGVVVAVLDTGIDFSHPQLQGRSAVGGYNFITNSAQTNDVGDGIDNDGDGETDEMVGHGTYVAGVIALTAPQAKLLPIVVLNTDGVGDNWSLTRGMYHAIDRGVEVINLSLGTTYDNDSVNAASLEAASRGISVVAAAGNFNRSCPREFPAMDDDHWVIGVAAVNDQDIKANFSNYNKRLFISAPGDSAEAGGGPDLARSIISTIPGGEYRAWKGTSMAVPIVSGAAALIRSQHPEWPADINAVITVRQRLAQTAVNIYPQNPQYAFDMELGVGRVDVATAVALGPPAPAPGDLNNDGSVNVNDLLRVINEWGMTHTSADINGDGTVNVSDLLFVINNWG